MKIIIVSKNKESGSYTSFTRAIYENCDDEKIIYVNEGIYDLREEYIELFGEETIRNMNDNTSLNGFQLGIPLKKCQIVFNPDSQLVCDWTGYPIDATHRFSPLCVYTDVELIGLNLFAKRTFYAIHDDYGDDSEYKVKYSHCGIVGSLLYNGNCIGGGCKPKSFHFIDDCFFDNGFPNSTVVRYHNTHIENGTPVVVVSNSTFNGILSFNWYGPMSTKMTAIAINCKAKDIIKTAEIPGSTEDNICFYLMNK